MHRRTATIFLVLTALIVLLVCTLYLFVRLTENKNLMLVSAVVRSDVKSVVAALNNGANANFRLEPTSDLLAGSKELQMPGTGTYASMPTILAIALNIDILGKPQPSPKVNFDIIKALLDHGASIQSGEFLGTPALISSVSHGYYATTKLLLDRGANINARDAFGATALHHACVTKEISEVKLLLHYGADVNIADDLGETILMQACLAGLQPASIQLLLDHGAKINQQDKKGRTALMIAVQTGDLSTVQLLLRNNADPHIKDNNGETAYDIAIKHKKNRIVTAIKK
jgi:ankyrin repeat protein